MSCFPNFLGPYKGGRSDVLNKQHNKIFDGDKYAVLESGHLDKKNCWTKYKKLHISSEKALANENELVKVFNKHYVNIIEKSGGQKPTNIAKRNSIDNDRQAVELICNSYRNHPSILKIKSNITAKGCGVLLFCIVVMVSISSIWESH